MTMKTKDQNGHIGQREVNTALVMDNGIFQIT